MTQSEFTQYDLVLRLHGGANNGTLIPVKTQNCLLGENLNSGQGQQCAIIRGPQGTAIRSYGSDVIVNGNAVDCEWLQQGDRIELCEMTVEVVQLGQFLNTETEIQVPQTPAQESPLNHIADSVAAPKTNVADQLLESAMAQVEPQVPAEESIQENPVQEPTTVQEPVNGLAGLASFDELAQKIQDDFSHQTDTPLQDGVVIQPEPQQLSQPETQLPAQPEAQQQAHLETQFDLPVEATEQLGPQNSPYSEPENTTTTPQSHDEFLSSALSSETETSEADLAGCDSPCSNTCNNECGSYDESVVTEMQIPETNEQSSFAQPMTHPENVDSIQTPELFEQESVESIEQTEPVEQAFDQPEASDAKVEKDPNDWMDRLKRDRESLTKSRPKKPLVEEGPTSQTELPTEPTESTTEAEQSEAPKNESVAELLARMQSAGTIESIDYSDDEPVDEPVAQTDDNPQPQSQVEETQPEPTATDAPAVSSDEEEDAVQKWMQKLTGGTVGTAAVQEAQNDVSTSAEPVVEEPAKPMKLLTPDEFKPKSQPIAKAKDLSAMRELANANNQNAISKSMATRKKAAIVSGIVVIGVVSILVAIYCLLKMIS